MALKWWEQTSILDREASDIASRAQTSLGIIEKALQKAEEERERKQLAIERIAKARGEALMRSLKSKAIAEGRMLPSGRYPEPKEAEAQEAYQANIEKVYNKARKDILKTWILEPEPTPEDIQVALNDPKFQHKVNKTVFYQLAQDAALAGDPIEYDKWKTLYNTLIQKEIAEAGAPPPGEMWKEGQQKRKLPQQ